MYEYCKSCVHDKGDIGFCDKCGYTYMHRKRGLPPTEYEAEPKPQTNADHIRAMTDEELAEKIGGSIDCEACRTMHHFESDECPSKPHQHCADFWLDWLRQESEA